MQTGAIKKPLGAYIWNNKAFYLMMALPLIYYTVFCYFPMFGIVIAFKKYSARLGFWASEWVGLQYFRTIFSSYDFPNAMKNTVLISLYRLAWGFPMPIIFSLLLNEIRNSKFKRVTQSISYMPHFLSWVIIFGLVTAMLSLKGPVNSLIKFFGAEPIIFLQSTKHIRSVLVITGIWKELGWGTLLYLAAIASVDMELYEAAIMDGAGRFKQTIYVTLPAIVPTITILLILNTGSILNAGFEQIMLMTNDVNRPTIEILDTLTYRMGIVSGNYSYGAAAGLFKSAVGMCLILFSNALSRRVGETSLL